MNSDGHAAACDRHASVSSVGAQLAEVENGQADLAVAGISITRAREQAVDFSYPMYSSGLQVMVSATGRAPRPSLLRASAQLWRPLAGILVMLFVVAHLAWLVESRRNPEHFPRPYFKGIGEGLWWGSVTLATVGYGDRTPRSVWGRLLAMVWMHAKDSVRVRPFDRDPRSSQPIGAARTDSSGRFAIRSSAARKPTRSLRPMWVAAPASML
jgi:hypothetical protein